MSEGSTGNVINTAMLQTTDADNTPGQLVYTVTGLTSNGTLRLNGTALSVNDTFTQADIDAGLVTYDHNGSETASDAFSFSVNDGQGATSSGAFNFVVTPVNDEQVVAVNTGATVSEGSTGNVISTTMLQTTDADNTPGQLVYTVTGLASNGTLRLSNSVLNLNDTFTQADIDAGLMTYDHEGGEAASDAFSFNVDDGQGATSSGAFNFVVTPVNDEQVVAVNTGATVSEGSTGNVISTTMLQTTDADNTRGQLVYTVTGLTSNGTLRLNGTLLNVNNTFTQADIDAGLVTYDHEGGEAASDAFSFSVNDGQGAASQRRI